MRIIRDLGSIGESFRYPVLTIGNFDGFHLGHQAIFKKMVSRANEVQGTSMAFTFEPHPLKVLAPQKPLRLLSAFEEKVRLIEAEGVDILLCPSFTRDFADQRPKDFVRNILYMKLGIKEIFVGYDYAFGKGREGTVDSLKKMSAEFGFKVDVIDPVKIGKGVVSSSRIREFIAKGKVKDAAIFLGRPYSLEGRVIKGKGRGAALLGFPTANISISNADLLVPKEGIYAVTVYLGDEHHKGAANIGRNPTFGNGDFSFEVYILDFDRDLLGSKLRVKFVDRLRDEIAFTSPEALSKQIKKDVEAVRNIFKERREQ